MVLRGETQTHFHGWRMVGVAFVVEFVAVGFFFYSFGVYFKAIEAELAGSRLGVSLGMMATSAVGAILAPFVGRALDRYPIKRIMLIGAVALSFAFALLSRVNTIWQFYLVLGTFVAFGMSMMGGLATAKLVANWFHARRGTALGIVNDLLHDDIPAGKFVKLLGKLYKVEKRGRGLSAEERLALEAHTPAIGGVGHAIRVLHST